MIWNFCVFFGRFQNFEKRCFFQSYLLLVASCFCWQCYVISKTLSLIVINNCYFLATVMLILKTKNLVLTVLKKKFSGETSFVNQKIGFLEIPHLERFRASTTCKIRIKTIGTYKILHWYCITYTKLTSSLPPVFP